MSTVSYLSYTGYTHLRDCPKRYQNMYIRKLRPPMLDQRNTIKGNALHNLLEWYLLNGVDDPNLLVEYAPLYWTKMLTECEEKSLPLKWVNAVDEKESRAKYIEWAYRLATLMKRHDLTPDRIQPEFKADSYITMGPHRFKMGGRVDILLRNKAGGLVVLDLKGSERKEVMQFDQLVWYAMLTENYLEGTKGPTGEPERVTHAGWLLPGFAKEEDRIQIFAIPQSARDKLEANIIRALDRIVADDFPVNPKTPEGKDNCWFCDVKYVCPLFGGSADQSAGVAPLGIF